jgi:geranylgeranylglycerol-phosphate geranylgeranyltransferase
MVWHSVYVFSRLTRLDTSGLAFLAIAVPLYYETGNIEYAATNSLPVLTTAMCGFVLNDIHDIEKDVHNHPKRPLPSKQISVACATSIYFALIVISLVFIKTYVAAANVYLYLIFIVGMINYNYVVSHFPMAKNFYVAIVSIVPIMILTSLIPNQDVHWSILLSLFAGILGREILMDIQDASGDGDTFAKRIGASMAEKIGLTAHTIGVASLSLHVRDVVGAVNLGILIISECAILYFWKQSDRSQTSVLLFVMKLQLLLGVYYLL